MHWLNQTTIYKSGINIGVPHETNETMFDYVLTIDPNETETDKKFNIPRPIFEDIDSIISNMVIKNPKIKTFIEYNEGEDVPIFGSFGFGFHNKGFEKIIEEVSKQYDKAIIKLLITFAHFDQNREANIRDIVNRCESIERKSGIKLIITHEFFTNEEILMFLSSNTCNIFLYDKMLGRGISSAIDYAISVNVPCIISDSYMFRNIYSDDICIYKNSIINCIENSKNLLKNFRNLYSNKNLIEKFNNIINILSTFKMFGFEVSAYYYTENHRQEGNVTKKLMALFEEFKSTGKNAFDINNETFGDTFSGYLKYLYINFKNKNCDMTLQYEENKEITWNYILNILDNKLSHYHIQI
jgi:hypothetical protein